MLDTIVAVASDAPYFTAAISTGGGAALVYGIYRVYDRFYGKLADRVTRLEGHAQFMEKELTDQTNAINRIEDTVQQTAKDIGEVHGTLKMLPCVRDPAHCKD